MLWLTTGILQSRQEFATSRSQRLVEPSPDRTAVLVSKDATEVTSTYLRHHGNKTRVQIDPNDGGVWVHVGSE